MTDQTPPQEGTPAPATSAPAPQDPASGTPAPQPSSPSTVRSPLPATPLVWSRVVGGVNPAMVVAIVALLLAGWQWTTSQKESATLQAELARRLAEAETIGKETRLIADQVRNSLRDVESRMGLMEARLIETQNQRIALEALYQELARNRDEWVLSEIEQILVTASQQLQLAGNVRTALIALEAADKRLAQADRPGLLGLRRVLARDIERLKSAPFVDVPGMTLKIDNVIAGVSGFPLASEQRPSASSSPRPPAADGAWTRLASEALQDLRDLLRIRVAETREVPLLAPEQAYFLRENLRLKLLSARLALMARDEPAFRADLRTAADWLTQYFDTSVKPVANAAGLLKQYGNAELAIQIPDIGDSLQAVRARAAGPKGPYR